MNERLHRGLAVLVACYLALLPTGEMTIVKSYVLGTAAALALIVLVRGLVGRDEPVAAPPLAVVASLFAWSGWSALTWFWSKSPDYSFSQIARELFDAGLLVVASYVAARDIRSLRTIIGAAIGSMIALGLLAIALDFTAGGWDPGRWHLGVGPWSTFLVIVAPLAVVLIAGPPLGPSRGLGFPTAGVAAAVLIATARMSENRMVWIALASAFTVMGAAAAWRWRGPFLRSRWRWIGAFAMAIVAMGFLLADAAHERAQRNFPANTTIAATFAEDPRLPLWEHAGPKIAERFWTGHGFGRRILGDQFARELGNPLLTHVHNLFLSQWVQSGAIGLTAFCALLASLAATYLRLLRARDDPVALIGTIGLALVIGFVVRNLTDDFLFRSNAKEFWLLNAALVGGAMALKRRSRKEPPPARREPSRLPDARNAVATVELPMAAPVGEDR